MNKSVNDYVCIFKKSGSVIDPRVLGIQYSSSNSYNERKEFCETKNLTPQDSTMYVHKNDVIDNFASYACNLYQNGSQLLDNNNLPIHFNTKTECDTINDPVLYNTTTKYETSFSKKPIHTNIIENYDISQYSYLFNYFVLIYLIYFIITYWNCESMILALILFFINPITILFVYPILYYYNYYLTHPEINPIKDLYILGCSQFPNSNNSCKINRQLFY